MAWDRKANRDKPHWLYRLYDKDGELLYIGQTVNPVARFQNWFSRYNNGITNTWWFGDTKRIVWQRYPDYESVRLAEKSAIETERPLHNRDHQPRVVA